MKLISQLINESGINWHEYDNDPVAARLAAKKLVDEAKASKNKIEALNALKNSASPSRKKGSLLAAAVVDSIKKFYDNQINGSTLKEMDPDFEAGAYDREGRARDESHRKSTTAEEDWNKLAHLLDATNIKNRPNAQHLGLAGIHSSISMDLPKGMRLGQGGEREPATVALMLPRKFGADEKGVVKHFAKKNGHELYDHDFSTYSGNYEAGKFNCIRLGYYTSMAGEKGAAFKHLIIQLVEYFESEL